MKNGNRAVGRKGENIAARFLARRGYRIIARNIRTYVGEIDIVAKKNGVLIFAEVKTRKSAIFGPPYLAIDRKKKRKLIQCVLCYLKMRNFPDIPCQIDVISVEIRPFFWFIKKIKIEHFKNAIEE